MTEELHELFCFLRDHDCVEKAMITTPEGLEYMLEWNSSGCIVTHTDQYRIG